MPYTTPPTATTGNIITAANGNVWRDDLNYHQGLLDGTGSGGVIFPAAATIANDPSWYLSKNGANPLINFDANDALIFDRASNAFQVYIGAQYALTVSSGGRLAGLGFYDSGAVSIGAGVSTDFSHGLGARPRFVRGWFSTSASGDLADGSSVQTQNILVGGVAADVRFGFSNNTLTRVTNGLGVTAWVRVFAML